MPAEQGAPAAGAAAARRELHKQFFTPPSDAIPFPEGASVAVSKGGAELGDLDLAGGDCYRLVGKDETRCDLVLEHPSVSRVHAAWYYTAGGARVVDLGSRHGTYVQGKRIPANTATEWPQGVCCRFAASTREYRLTAPPPAAPAPPAKKPSKRKRELEEALSAAVPPPLRGPAAGGDAAAAAAAERAARELQLAEEARKDREQRRAVLAAQKAAAEAEARRRTEEENSNAAQDAAAAAQPAPAAPESQAECPAAAAAAEDPPATQQPAPSAPPPAAPCPAAAPPPAATNAAALPRPGEDDGGEEEDEEEEEEPLADLRLDVFAEQKALRALQRVLAQPAAHGLAADSEGWVSVTDLAECGAFGGLELRGGHFRAFALYDPAARFELREGRRGRPAALRRAAP
eukprot:TRINITY_DN40611_c0_g1_i2.p1 TRINITY_DN40611_c0_g1~~TRINITY_DN40611_c0_g1_i2.p1  ORF type:complete len:403 (+),score=127.38 TRINITY_DN40611_c0_g1_i2:158-1366(+)